MKISNWAFQCSHHHNHHHHLYFTGMVMDRDGNARVGMGSAIHLICTVINYHSANATAMMEGRTHPLWELLNIIDSVHMRPECLSGKAFVCGWKAWIQPKAQTLNKYFSGYPTRWLTRLAPCQNTMAR